jgi:hypothetical protein
MTVIGVEWRCRRLSLSVGSSVDELGRLGLASSATRKVRVRVKWHLVAQRIALAETCRPALMLAPAIFNALLDSPEKWILPHETGETREARREILNVSGYVTHLDL